MPDPIGTCRFLNDLTVDELVDTLTLHKKICAATTPAAATAIDMFTGDDAVRRRDDGHRRAAPVTPTTILAAELTELCRELDRHRRLDADVAGRLRRARDLAAGWTPTSTRARPRNRRRWPS